MIYQKKILWKKLAVNKVFRVFFDIRWPCLALGFLLLINLIFSDGFFVLEIKDGHLYGSIIDILNRAAPVALLALGMTLVIATGGIDLSVGSVLAISGAVAASLAAGDPSSLPFIMIAALAAGAPAGAGNGLLVGALNIQPIVATLILMVSGRGIAQLITGGQIVSFHHSSFEFLGSGFFLAIPFTVTIVTIVYIASSLALRKTSLGLFVESIGNNPRASYFTGINATRIKVLVYTFSGICAAIAGMIVASDIRAADVNNAGLYFELDAIMAVVLGGTALTGGRFSLLGTIVGVLIIQTLTTTILTWGIAVEFTLVVKAVTVLLVILLQSEAFRVKIKPRGAKTS